jgi:hypothetical protein
VIRSDVSEAHRLSLSGRVLSAQDGQVKAKQHLGSTSAACNISRFAAAGITPQMRAALAASTAEALFLSGYYSGIPFRVSDPKRPLKLKVYLPFRAQ